MTTRVIQVIWSDEGWRGKGVKDDPVRTVYRLYTLDGRLVVETDLLGTDVVVHNEIQAMH